MLKTQRFSQPALQFTSDWQKPPVLHGQTPSRARYHYPRWVQRWPVTWIRVIAHYLLLRPAIFLLGWPRVEGREKLTGMQGPVLVICNHVSDVDVGFVFNRASGPTSP